MADAPLLARLRAERERRRAELSASQRELADAQAALRQLRQTVGDRDERAMAAAARARKAEAALAAARETHAAVAGRFDGALKEGLSREPADDFSALSTTAPLVLLPVRIETRFALGGDARELWIRVYPDEIHGDGHEPELTDEEVAAGQAYWQAVWDRPDTDRDAWKTLVLALGPTRAAWVAQVLTPTNADADHGQQAPDFPQPPRRTHAWTRAVEARLLPDRWVAIGVRGGQEVRRAAGQPIVEPLALSMAPDAAPADLVDVSGDGLMLDQGQLWTVDFERALAVGMALKMPLSADDARDGFDQLLVVGVKGSVAPDDAGAALAQLLEAHHYQRGLALVRQGTPTNNTQDSASPVPLVDPDGVLSWAVEREPARSIAGRDGERLATALGVPKDALVRVDRSDADEQAGARAMCGALWPVTWGYFFEELLFEDERDADVAALRRHFIDHVRARGPLPAFRVGSAPYGVLVTSSLSRWVQRGHRGIVQDSMAEELRTLREIWRQQLGAVPRVGRSNDPDRDLLDILAGDASSREVRVQSVVGPNASLNLAGFFGIDWTPARQQQFQLAQELAARLGNPAITSRVFALAYGNTSTAFAKGLVVARPKPEEPERLSETEALAPFNYIRWLREAGSIDEVRDERLPAGVERPTTLLYLLLRHAMLREAARSADDILVKAGVIERALVREPEFPGAVKAAIAPDLTRAAGAATAQKTTAASGLTPAQRLELAVPEVTGEFSVSKFVWSPVIRAENARVREFREYLRALEDLPTAELERLLTETLDVCSHRLDAWIGAMATERLWKLRAVETPTSVLGAYGWVADLRPKASVERRVIRPEGLDELTRRRLKLPQGASLEEQVSSGGHVHAASMTQAATAAILRNGYLSRRQVDGQRYGVDLSSARVRQARWVLEAVRNGQPLGAVLGYQFERGLHEGHPGRELDRYIEPFRAAYPLASGVLTPTAPGEAAETVSARHVVHGLRLHEAFTADPPTIAWGAAGLPPASGPDHDAVRAELRALDDTIDAVSDLLLAESVFQFVSGNTAGASATLDSLSRGARPPEPEVVRSPRGGTALVHRVVLVLDPGAALPAAWAAITPTPRSRAEPVLDAWLARLIGDPARVRCAVRYTRADQSVAGPVEVTLAELGLRALDVASLAGADVAANVTEGAQANTSAQAGELDARITARVLGRADADPRGKVTIDYAATDREATRSFPEIAALMHAAGAVLSTARALAPEDLLAREQQAMAAQAVPDDAELQGRATAAVAALGQAATDLGNAIVPLDVEPLPVTLLLRRNLVAALRAAAGFGLARAYVPSPNDEADAQVEPGRLADLLALAKGVLAELAQRRTAALAATTPQQTFDAVFGEGFKATRKFVPAAAALEPALTAGPSPVPHRGEVRAWLRGASLVRTPLRRWLALQQHARALGRAPADTVATQLPHAPGRRWAAATFASPDDRPPSGTLGLALVHDDPLPAAGGSWAGLWLDEWTELIPNREQSTAVAFHYDDPGAEAPQAVLVAVPPDAAQQWSLEVVRDTLLETLELAALRAVDGDQLGSLAQLLPATFVAANPKKDTISTRFAEHLALDRAIVKRSV